MVKISVENEAVVTASVLFFRQGIGDDLMHFRGPVENIEENPDNLLIVGNVGFRLDVSGGFFDDLINGWCQVREDLV